MNKTETTIFSREELGSMQVGLEILIEDFSKSITQPWTPEARKSLNEILTSAKTAKAKIEKITGITAPFPNVTEQEFRDAFTKES